MLPSFVVRACRDQDRAGVVACIALDGSAQDNPHFEIGIGRPPPPPIASGFAAAPEGERGEKRVERLQG
jgi:hypothetical protein